MGGEISFVNNMEKGVEGEGQFAFPHREVGERLVLKTIRRGAQFIFP